jgi:uncharacterized protein with HEPN domain
MRDKELVIEVLRQIKEASAKIIVRFQTIRQVADFTDSPAGVDKMDAICMMLIVIGESLKNLDKITSGSFLPQYPEVDWKKAKGMRDDGCASLVPLVGQNNDHKRGIAGKRSLIRQKQIASLSR